MIMSPARISDSLDATITVLRSSIFVTHISIEWLITTENELFYCFGGILQQIDVLVLCTNNFYVMSYSSTTTGSTWNTQLTDALPPQRSSTRPNCHAKTCTGLSSCLNQALWHEACEIWSSIALFLFSDCTENILISTTVWDWADITETEPNCIYTEAPGDRPILRATHWYRNQLHCWIMEACASNRAMQAFVLPPQVCF